MKLNNCWHPLLRSYKGARKNILQAKQEGIDNIYQYVGSKNKVLQPFSERYQVKCKMWHKTQLSHPFFVDKKFPCPWDRWQDTALTVNSFGNGCLPFKKYRLIPNKLQWAYSCTERLMAQICIVLGALTQNCWSVEHNLQTPTPIAKGRTKNLIINFSKYFSGIVPTMILRG